MPDDDLLMPDDVNRPIRILLADLPDFVAEYVELLLKQGGVDVVSSAQGASAILDNAAKVDVVVMGIEHMKPLPDICGHLLRTYPRLKILALTHHENMAVCYWVDIRRSRIRPLNGEKLLDGVLSLFDRTSRLFLEDDTLG